MENRIRSERALADMSQPELAEFLNVHENTVRRWEKDITDAPLGKVVAMSERFGCTIDYLIGKSETRCS